ATAGDKEGGFCARPGREQYASRFDWHSTSARAYLLGRLARWTRASAELQPIATDGQRNTLQSFWQLCLRYSWVSHIRNSPSGNCGSSCERHLQGQTGSSIFVR